jgi:isoleucyl-tRNA synthetase
LARELVNRIQSIRKDYNFEVTDKIEVDVEKNDKIDLFISNNLSYICGETLANSLNIVDVVTNNKISVDLVDGISVNISIKKI